MSDDEHDPKDSLPASERLEAIELDPASLSAASAEVEHERRVAIFDLIEQNRFAPVGADGGPYRLRLSFEDNRLVLDITGGQWRRSHLLSLTPLRAILRDYHMICESYHEAVRGSSPGRIEAVDMGRRGLHNEGAALLRERLSGKIGMDHESARRLFTLIYSLSLRG